jgi:hypothetical protein
LEGSTTEEQKVGAFEIARKEFAYSDILRITGSYYFADYDYNEKYHKQ